MIRSLFLVITLLFSTAFSVVCFATPQNVNQVCNEMLIPNGFPINKQCPAALWPGSYGDDPNHWITKVCGIKVNTGGLGQTVKKGTTLSLNQAASTVQHDPLLGTIYSCVYGDKYSNLTLNP